MSIAFQCSCGKTIKAHDSNAGQRVRCPICAELVTVPAKTPGNEVEPPSNEEVVDAELVEEENEGFDVLEEDRDLPTVERPKKPRKKKVGQFGPRRRSIQDDLYDAPPTFFGLDAGSSAKTLLYIASVGVFGLFVLCLVCGVLGRIMQMK